MSADLRRLADIVRERRTEAGMTQQELAGKVGVSKGTIQNLEGGKAATDPATLARVGRVLGIELSTPTAVATAQVIAQSVEAIRSELTRSARDMDSAEQIMFFGDVMGYVHSWEPARR